MYDRLLKSGSYLNEPSILLEQRHVLLYEYDSEQTHQPTAWQNRLPKKLILTLSQEPIYFIYSFLPKLFISSIVNREINNHHLTMWYRNQGTPFKVSPSS